MKSISEAYKDHPINLHHIVPLDFDNDVHALPESHEWPPLDQHSIYDANQTGTIPVIDMADPNIVKLVCRACEELGAFQIINHGIPLRFLDKVESETRRLFSLPTQQKLKALRTPGAVGGYGRARMSTFFPKFLWQEGFTIVDPSSAIEQASKLWPLGEHTSFCDVMEEYQKKLKELADSLMCLMLESLGVSKEDLRLVLGSSADESEDVPHTALQLNSYPACPDPNRAMGLAAHTDTSLFTILSQSRTSKGLQIHRDGFGWVTVPPVAGALVVNIGDLFHILSNGRFTSAVHRAVVNKTNHRWSIAYFYGPPCNSRITPIPKLVDSSHPLRYRSTTWREYIGIKAKHFDKSLFFIVNPPK